MQTDLWIVLARDNSSKDGLYFVQSFEVEHDPLPGLLEALSASDPAPARRFYALRISPKRDVSLREIIPTPHLGESLGQIGMFPDD